ncbi:diguanylate cyclase [Euzebya rosea]|uniref:GGDEF domain-containing response regulator n=1 Tax=Euzebya rosea TaxID=2052804 RepID=UPI000D3E875D|nr:diguanylate cyclase response regulator [Euzebya rosea]
MHRRHLHVLVVEDSDADAVVVHERLTEAAPIDVRVDRVPSLGQAVASLEQTAFDAVIYDMGLPDAQGLPGFRELALAAPDTPIVILTGNDDADTASTALAERAQEFLPKQMMDSPWLLRAVQHAIERHRLLVEVESLALEDPVTGLHNRRGLDFLGRQHLRHADRTGSPVTLLYLDLDAFKAINDAHGHAYGDQVLRAVGEVLSSCCRDVDIAARVGGDEFALLVVGDQPAAGASIVERVRDAVDGLGDRGLVPRDFGVSIGAAHRPCGDREMDLEHLLRVADLDMYRDKAARRVARSTQGMLRS